MLRSMTVVSCFIFSVALNAQFLSVNVSPNPAPVGAPITVTCQATIPGLFTPLGCLLSGVRSGTPTGPNVALFACTFLPGAIPQCGATTVRTGIWNQNLIGGGTATPGLYFFQINYTVGQFGAQQFTEYFCVTVHNPAVNPTPSLTAVNAPQFGTQFQMSLNAPTHPNEFYAVVMSTTTNVGLAYPGGFTCLDNDFLLQATLNPNPAIFVNFAGATDPTGLATGIAINFPAVVGLGCVPLHAVAFIVDGGGGITQSNDLKITVQ